MSTQWDLDATENLVAALHGREWARDKFREHANSVNRRIEYAVYHFDEVLRLHDEYMRDHFRGRTFIQVKLGAPVDREALDDYIKRSQAHAVALAQSLHAIPDTHAHTLYYALKLDALPNPLKPRDIGAYHVRNVIQAQSAFDTLGEQCQAFSESIEFKYLDGLVNHSKHRSLVLAGFYEDWTGTRAEKHELRVSAFTYKEPQPQRAVKEVFPLLIEHCATYVVDTGNELHRLLAAQVGPAT